MDARKRLARAIVVTAIREGRHLQQPLSSETSRSTSSPPADGSTSATPDAPQGADRRVRYDDAHLDEIFASIDDEEIARAVAADAAVDASLLSELSQDALENLQKSSPDSPSIPLCSFARPLGPARGDKAKGIPGDQIFEAADFQHLSGLLREWYPEHPWDNPEDNGPSGNTTTQAAASSSKSQQSSNRKRKRAEEKTPGKTSIRLDAELIIDPYDSGYTKDGDEWSMYIVAFAPEDVIQRLKSKRGRPPNAAKTAVLLGSLNFQRSVKATHPFSSLHPALFLQDWLRVTRCQVELATPFFQRSAALVSDCRSVFLLDGADKKSSKPTRLTMNAKVHVDLALSHSALSYGSKEGEDGCIQSRKDHGAAFRDLVARLVHFDNGKPSSSKTSSDFKSLVELDDLWPDPDFWQGKRGSRKPFYDLPKRSALVEYDSDSSVEPEGEDANSQATAPEAVSQPGPSTLNAPGQDTHSTRRKKSKLPPLSLGSDGNLAPSRPDTQTSGTKVVRGEWLCHVYIEVPQSYIMATQWKRLIAGVPDLADEEEPAAELVDLWQSRDEEGPLDLHWLHEETSGAGTNDDAAAKRLHISLTRPILLRAHERDAFVQEVTNVIRQSAPDVLDFAFANAASLVNDDATRMFLALEVGQGHEELSAITKALDKRLRELFQAQEYYAEARYHCSAAYYQRGGAEASTCLTAKQRAFGEAEALLMGELFSIFNEQRPFRARAVCIRVGKQVVRLQIKPSGTALPLRSGIDILAEHLESRKKKDAAKFARRLESFARGSDGSAAQSATPSASSLAARPNPPSDVYTEGAEEGAEERDLPLSSSLNSLLLAARPDPNSPELHPPQGLIKTPLYKFQRQALAWMIDRETNVNDVTGLPLPNWVRIRNRRSLADTDEQKSTSQGKQGKGKARADTVPAAQADSKNSEVAASARSSPSKVKGQPKASAGASHQKQRSKGSEPSPTKRQRQSLGKGPEQTDEEEISNGNEVDAAVSAACDSFYLDVVSGTPSDRAFFTQMPRQSGGVLADAMGLGKTLEILSLIAAHPRPLQGFKDTSRSAQLIAEMTEEDRPLETGATLIVVPHALLQQWVNEIHRHLRTAEVVVYAVEWQEEQSRKAVREEMRELLKDVTICLVSYEALSRDYIRSKAAAKQSRQMALSPLLEVLWYRIVLDEAQLFAAGSPGSSVSGMCGSLWRSHSWVCSSTPLRRCKDLLAILTFLDYDVLVVRNFFNEFVEGNLIRAKTDAEAARQIRSLMVKLFWRHERAHVADQLSLPPQTDTTLGVTARGLEAAIYTREFRRARQATCEELAKNHSRPQIARFAVQRLRQLLSHPSVTSELGYAKADTFASLFGKMHAAARREFVRDVLEGCSLVVALDTLVKVLEHEEENFDWRGAGKNKSLVITVDALKKALRGWSARCEVVVELQIRDKLYTAADVDALEAEEWNTTDATGDLRSIVRHSNLTAREAKVALKQCLAYDVPEEFPPKHRNRGIGLAFQPEVSFVDQVDAALASRYHPLVTDAGSAEDSDWLQELLGDDYADVTKRAAAEKMLRAQGNDANPVVMKNRLRGKAEGHRAKERVWAWIPKRSLQATKNELEAVALRCDAKLQDLRWIENRMHEEGVEIRTSAVTRSTGSEGGGSEGANGSDAADAASDERDCIICLETPIVVGLLPCLHSACYDCLCELAKTNAQVCPYCRRGFDGIRDIQEILPARRSSADEGEGNTGYEMSEAEGEYGIKVAALAMDIMERLKKDGSTKVVIFSMWRMMLQKVHEGLYKMGIECAVFAGSGNAEARALYAFGRKGDGGKSVLLCPMRMSEGAAGLTLTMANVAYIMEPVLNANLLAQAKGRLNRIGQERPTTIVQMYVKDSIEERILELLEQRRNNHDSDHEHDDEQQPEQQNEVVPNGVTTATAFSEQESLSTQESMYLFQVDDQDVAEARRVRRA